MSVDLLPSGINDERSRALAELMDRLSDADREVLLTSRVDSVPATALYALAWQFDVLGLSGWDLAHTTAERRELIKRAIELHKSRGTPYAIEHALDAVGFTDAIVEEGIAAGLDHWAKFRVSAFRPEGTPPISVEEQALVRPVIEIYKNARSVLEDVVVTGAPLYDGSHSYDGSFTYNGWRRVF